jgi:cytochrome c peroxidase
VASETAQEGAFRTASLRGVAQRTFFGHAAHEQTLRGFILDIYRGRGRRGGGGRAASVGVLDPKLAGVNVDDEAVDDLIAFLHTLDCPATSL